MCSYLPQAFAISYTAVVLPVPVSPTSNTVSFIFIPLDTYSSSLRVEDVKTKFYCVFAS